MHSRRIKLLALAALAAWWRLPDLAHGDPYPPVVKTDEDNRAARHTMPAALRGKNLKLLRGGSSLAS